MKKPNITEGEWRKATNMLEEAVVISNNRPIATMYEGGVKNIRDIVQAETNATAISAVPEMLDALMASKRFVDVVADENVEIDRDLKSQINKALKKSRSSTMKHLFMFLAFIFLMLLYVPVVVLEKWGVV